ncbi:TRAP transporter large permease [Spiribacter halobius]|uniref:C4-dicarboxylate ABC transporter n=1 Tax=Sediminicurvatus halobius TaxID=2182432 RepID=A0A2U2N667_9GAMM|nr:TRAP transporter large permease subunit [Spiribacter halobius]PWG64572.1 C4-dicarboxylate ABC transporter [Spiribacter halobius]UEX79108.1 TRAP transporter large permease subunit [Spiribacter halobius]
MSPEILGLLLLGALFVMILVGFPIAFTLIFVALVTGYIGIGFNAFNLMMVQVERTMEMTLLAAVPLFVFMGLVLERAGLMQRLFLAFQMLFAPVRGSLYMAVMGTATLFSMATGIVGASVTVIGLMAGKTMQRSGYDVRMSAGAITAGGTLGILIPPSIMLIVMGPILEVSILALFAAAVVPGLMLAAIFLAYCMIRSHFQPSLGPALPPEDRAPSAGYIVKELLLGVVPLAVIIAAVLGSILSGIATPTEAAGMGAFASLCLAAAYRRLNWEKFRETLLGTLQTSSMVLLLIAAANFFGAVFSILGTPRMVTEWLIGLGLPLFVLLLLLLLLVFLMGWALDWAPIVLIFLPVIMPVMSELDVNMVWFGALVAVCLQTAWLTPPVALAAYFLKGVMPDWELKDIYLGMLQFMGLQLIGLLLVLTFPEIALWLPGVLLGR